MPSKPAHLADIAGKQNSHEFVFALQLTGNERERRSRVGVVVLLLAQELR